MNYKAKNHVTHDRVLSTFFTTISCGEYHIELIEDILVVEEFIGESNMRQYCARI